MLAVIAFVLAIRFFQNSRRRLQELFPDIAKSRRLLPFTVDRNGFLLPNKTYKKAKTVTSPAGRTEANAQPGATKEELSFLRSQLQQQQQQLEKALAQFQAFNHQSAPVFANATAVPDGQKSVEHRGRPGEKDCESQQLKQQTAHLQTPPGRLAKTEAEMDQWQAGLQEIENQARQVSELFVQLKKAEARQAHLEQTLLEKEEKLRELTCKNIRLNDALGAAQRELSQAALHQQQLLKKAHFLEAVNADLQQVSDANKKLKKEASRVAELESMVDLMTVERSVWQRRQ